MTDYMEFIYWAIRYIDRTEKRMKDRRLEIDLDSLPLDLQFCMKYKIEAENLLHSRELRAYRQYFHETAGFTDHGSGGFRATAGPVLYFEDEKGNQVYERDVKEILGLDPSVSTFPFPAYVDRYLAFNGSASDIKLDEDELRNLRIFSEHYDELEQSKIEFPGLTGVSAVRVIFKNSRSELKAFAMLFRKLYSNDPNEPGSFPNVSNFLKNHPNTALGLLAEDSLQYFNALKDVDIRKTNALKHLGIFIEPLFEKYPEPLTVHDIIQLILYTQYQHAAKKSREEKLNKIRAFLNSQDCDEILKHVFLMILCTFQLLFLNAGGSYAGVYKQLCCNPSSASSSAQIKQLGLRGISTVEIEKRKILEKYMRLYAVELWKEAGQSGTPYDFEAEAKTRILAVSRSHDKWV